MDQVGFAVEVEPQRVHLQLLEADVRQALQHQANRRYRVRTFDRRVEPVGGPPVGFRNGHREQFGVVVNCTQVLLRDSRPRSRKEPIALSPGMLQPVGFEENEALLPYPQRSFRGYRLLQEYFSFPEKFFFFDLKGLEALRASGFGDSAEVVFLLSRFERPDRAHMMESAVTPHTFRLGCTPIVNLFPQTAEPILLDQTKYDYPIVPDVRRQHAMEIYSIDETATGCSMLFHEPWKCLSRAWRKCVSSANRQERMAACCAFGLTAWHGSTRRRSRSASTPCWS